MALPSPGRALVLAYLVVASAAIGLGLSVAYLASRLPVVGGALAERAGRWLFRGVDWLCWPLDDRLPRGGAR